MALPRQLDLACAVARTSEAMDLSEKVWPKPKVWGSEISSRLPRLQGIFLDSTLDVSGHSAALPAGLSVRFCNHADCSA